VSARAGVAKELADNLRALGDTSAARRNKWADAMQHALMSAANITTARTTADMAVVHLDAECDRLRGEIDAQRVELEQIDFEARGR
jgi:hypothetical protein